MAQIGKQNLYEHSIGVPLIFAGPGLPKGKKNNALCHLHDIFPTLCDLAGLNTPETVTSKSLAPLIHKEVESLYDTQFYAYTKSQRAVRKDNWKLIRYNIKDTQTTQLFDLSQDPLEITNLANQPQYKDKVIELKNRLAELGKTLNDTEDWYQ